MFVAGGAVLCLLGYGGEVGDVVFGGHGHGAFEEVGEGGVAVEDVGAFGVDVEDVQGAGTGSEGGFDFAEEGFEDGGFEGVEEEGEDGGGGEVEGEGVLFEEADGCESGGGGVGSVGDEPVVEVELGDVGHGGVELDADDAFEGELAGDEHGAAFAGAVVDEGVVAEGMGWGRLEPLDDEGAEDAGGDAIVGGDVLVVGVSGDEVGGGDEAAGVDAVGEIEGMDGGVGELEEIAGAGLGVYGLRRYQFGGHDFLVSIRGVRWSIYVSRFQRSGSFVLLS